MDANLFDSLFTNIPTIFFIDVVINVFMAFVFGFVVSILYRFTYKGYSYSSDFVNTLVIITMVTSIVIMVIGNNLARAFGLVGAMSIIRFRTALKETRDIAFVFFALAAGMAAGSGNQLIGIVGVPIIGLIILLLYWSDYGTEHRNELLLKFWMLPEEGDEPIYLSVFKEYLDQYSLLNVKSARLGEFLALSFYIRFKKQKQSKDFVRELSGLEGIDKVSLTIGEENK